MALMEHYANIKQGSPQFRDVSVDKPAGAGFRRKNGRRLFRESPLSFATKIPAAVAVWAIRHTEAYQYTTEHAEIIE